MIKYDKDEIREVQNFTISRKEFSMKFEDLKAKRNDGDDIY